MDIKFKFNGEKAKVFVFYLTLFVFTWALCIRHNALDVDLWARLIMGMHVFQTGLPQYQDVISYTPTHTWYDPEWLSSAFIYVIQSKFGGTGLTILKIISSYLIMITISLAIKSRAKKYTVQYDLLYFVILLFIMRDCSAIAFLRCQFVSFILIGLWIMLLEKIRKGDDKLLYYLPFIMLFWLNTHGGCIAGVGILFLYGIGEFLNKKPFKKYFIAFFFVCLMFLINPWGIEYIKFMLDSAVLDRSWISEWQSPFGGDGFFAQQKVYKYLMILIYVSYLYKIWWKKITYSQLNKTKLIIILALTYLSAKYVKHTTLFIVVSSIYMYDDFYLIFNHLFHSLRRYLQINETVVKHFVYFKDIILYFSIYVYALIIILTVPLKLSHYPAYSYYSHYPIKPLEFMRINGIKGKMFAGFYNGSFTGYKYYPDLKIYMDGREEQVYSNEIFDEQMFFLNWIGDYPEAVVEKNPPDIFMIERDWPANIYLMNHKDYVKIYEDEKYNIYVKRNMAQFNYVYPQIDYNQYYARIFETKHDYSKKKDEMKK